MMWSLQIHGIGIVYLEDRRPADFCKFRDSLRRPVNSGPEWSTEEVPGKAGQLQIETLSQKEIKRKRNTITLWSPDCSWTKELYLVY